jgi:UDP-glucose 4-epimerase
MKVLLTGGAGFIGSHICEEYMQNGIKVIIVDKKPENALPPTLKNKVTYFQQDLTKPGLDTIIEKVKPDIINHHAALINVEQSFQFPVTYSKTNVYATAHLLHLSKIFGIKQFIFASSVAVYGEPITLPITEKHPLNPISIYASDKLCGEKLINLYKSNFITTIFRYANVYGPRQDNSSEGGVVSIFIKKFQCQENPIVFGDGNQTRDFIFVKDIAKANFLAIEAKISNALNISTNQKTSIYDLISQLSLISGKKVEIIYKPEREGDIKTSVLDNSLAKSKLNWNPTYSLDKGLKNTYTCFENEKN